MDADYNCFNLVTSITRYPCSTLSLIVYTETVVHLAPPAFAADAPYQVVIVTREDGSRVTGRTEGERLQIGDTVLEVDDRNGVPYFRKLA